MHSIKLLSKCDVARDTPMYTFTKPDNFLFRAGQYVTMRVQGGDFKDERGDFRAFSIASAPYQESLEFSMRRSASAFKRNIDCLSIGSEVEITPPVGKFLLPDELTHRPIIFLVGGVGITPVRSILRQAVYEKRRDRFILFYSNRTPQDAPFFNEVNHLSGIDLFVVNTMTDSIEQWDGERGFITHEMIEKYAPEFRDAYCYIVGTGQFIAAMKELLAKAGFDLDRVIADNFGDVRQAATK